MNSDTGGQSGGGSWTALGGSMLRLSWALTLLGAQHAVDLVERRRKNASNVSRSSRPLATSPIDAVVNVAEEHLGGAFRGVHRLGRECLPGVATARSGRS